MQLAFQHTYPAGPDAVAQLLRDEAFLADVAQHAGALSHSSRIEGDTTHLAMEIPAPDDVQKFVGRSVNLQLTMRFDAATADGSRPGHVTVEVPGMPVDASARARLTPQGDHTVGDYDGELKVRIPLVGKKVEAKVEPFVVAAFAGMEERARVWLTR